ncbi:hypothetical protein V9K67_03680 [Paraflavisolibacter sp. H34]
MEQVLKILGLDKEKSQEVFLTISAVLIVLLFLLFGAAVLYVLINSAA